MRREDFLLLFGVIFQKNLFKISEFFEPFLIFSGRISLPMRIT